jgi:hypothetical protein
MPKSYLTTVVSRLSLDVLKSAQRKREIYRGNGFRNRLLSLSDRKDLRWRSHFRWHFCMSWNCSRRQNA